MEFRPEVDVVPIPIAFPTDPWNIQGLVVVEFLSIHLFAYGLMSILSVLKTRKRKNDIEQENLYWLYYINSILMIGALVLFFSQGGVIDGHEFFTPPFPRYSADLFSVVAMYLIVFYLLIKKGHFKFSSKKYSKSSLSSFYKREKLNQIIQLIEDNKLYLNTGFSLRMLSERSGLSMHKISQILNEELHVNFVDLTNKYRIEEAKKRLLSDDFDSKMEQLAYDIGYKSKSTFFTLFKKETNSTPSNFRKNSRI
ncbi:MAG: AraC family transcriptional regulator [Bacteroidota bacterium]